MRIIAYAHGSSEEPVEVEGRSALCNDCLAVIFCENQSELVALTNGGSCPNCSGENVCNCASCIRR